jgi:endonuclease YncB( thermonuclease family)
MADVPSLDSYPDHKFAWNNEVVIGKCVHVYDGDTAHFKFMTEWMSRPRVFSCRMLRYNSAEMRTKDAEEKAAAISARDALSDMILGKYVSMQLCDGDPWGRPLVLVSILGEPPGIVNDAMLAGGHGVEYSGRGEKHWK